MNGNLEEAVERLRVMSDREQTSNGLVLVKAEDVHELLSFYEAMTFDHDAAWDARES